MGRNGRLSLRSNSTSAYCTWPQTGDQAADIPCLPELLQALAKALLSKRSALSGDELRFLRERLRMAPKEVAALVGVTAEQYSRLEHRPTATPTVDRLVRLLYVALAKLPVEAAEQVARTTWTAELDHAEPIIASQDENNNWIIRTMAA